MNWFRRIVGWTLVAVFVLLTSIGFRIVNYPKANFEGIYDCCIILGAAVTDSKPSPVFKARLDHAVELYQQGVVKRLIFTGGIGEGDTLSEGEVGATYARANGVSESDIFYESVSKTTLQNLRQAKRIMEENKLGDGLLISDHYHLRRSMKIAKWLGIDAGSSATPYSKYQSIKTKFPFLVREIYFSIHFRVFLK